MARAAYMTDEVFAILGGASVEGNALRLDGALDRKTYTKVNQVLETLGGAWNKKAKAHLFDRCPRAVIAAAMGEESAEEAPAELERDRIKRLQFFQTPGRIAEEMAEWAVADRSRVLEPSAGHGRLVQAALDRRAASVVAVELDQDNFRRLTHGRPFGDSVEAYHIDFLKVVDLWLADPAFLGFDAILMNPPFRNNQDIRHVAAAARLLRPNGRLAAIVSEHPFFAQDRESVVFRHRLEARGARTERLPADTFKEEGAQGMARMVFIERGDA